MRKLAAVLAGVLLLTLSGCTGHSGRVIAMAPTQLPADVTAAPASTPGPESTPTPTPEPTATPEPSSEPTPTATPAPSPSPTAAPSPTPTAAPDPTATPEPSAATVSSPASEPSPPADGEVSGSYVLNANTKKFHRPDCSSVKDIKPENRVDFTGLRSEVLNQGYAPCKKCSP